jgi:multidrug resistance efflux pump
MRRRIRAIVILLAVLALAAAGYTYATRPPTALVLTGIVTTDDVIVSPQVAGKIGELAVKEGDTVRRDQLLAVIAPDELRADTAYYAENQQGLSSQVHESEAALRFERRQTTDQIARAESTLASAEAQAKAAVADLENARLVFTRTQSLAEKQIAAPQEADQARTAFNAAQARVDALNRQVEAQRSAVRLARANAEQVSARRDQVQSSQHMAAAAAAQRAKADVRLRYTEVRAPIDGFVSVRAARQGEFVNPGQPIVTLVDPDNLWVRVDIEETYVDRVRIGDTLALRLPSGEDRRGTVFYRGADAGFATQRDVSRMKRDIRTFEIRLRVDNRDRRLAVGMTAYVTLPLQ